MRARFILFLLTIISANSSKIIGQQLETEHHHHEHSYELGLSLGLAYLLEDEIKAPSSHIHLVKRLGPENFLKRIAIGLGAEYIFTEHTHLSFLGSISYNPVAALIIDMSPGILISEHENNNEIQYITHLELTYEFDLNSFGLGPVIGIAFSGDDLHYSFGIHIGKGL